MNVYEAIGLIPENVQRGVELLDRENPNWREKINVLELNMSDCNQCILGQLYYCYTSGANRVRLYTVKEKFEFGFTTPVSSFYDKEHTAIYWKLLADEWKKMIEVG